MKFLLQKFWFRYLVFSLIILGFGARVFLASYMSIWGSDEGWSYWSSSWYFNKSLSFIIHNPADFAHPPGYYVVLSFMRSVTDNLVILRFSSIFFVIVSAFLLWKIGIKYQGRRYAKILVLAYSLSGYFLITDWMIRGYALTTTLIFCSIYLVVSYLTDDKFNYSKNKYLLILLLIHTLGLYIDYSFWWYHLGLFCLTSFELLFMRKVKDSLLSIYKLGVLIVAPLFFLVLHPNFFAIISKARDDMDWAWLFANPNVFIPYFLGTTGLPIVTYISFGLVVLGIYITIKQRSNFLLVAYISSVLAFAISMLTTYLYSPLFHVRNLLVVGVAVVFLIAEGIYWSVKRGYYLGLIIVVICFVNTLLLLLFDSRSVWIDVYPWRYMIPRYHQSDNKYYMIDQSTQIFFYNDIETPFKNWTLEYTLEGRDALFGIQQKYVRGAPDLSLCVEILDPLWECNN